MADVGKKVLQSSTYISAYIRTPTASAQDHAKAAFEDLQGEHSTTSLGNLYQCHSKEVLPGV